MPSNRQLDEPAETLNLGTAKIASAGFAEKFHGVFNARKAAIKAVPPRTVKMFGGQARSFPTLLPPSRFNSATH